MKKIVIVSLTFFLLAHVISIGVACVAIKFFVIFNKFTIISFSMCNAIINIPHFAIVIISDVIVIIIVNLLPIFQKCSYVGFGTIIIIVLPFVALQFRGVEVTSEILT